VIANSGCKKGRTWRVLPFAFPQRVTSADGVPLVSERAGFLASAQVFVLEQGEPPVWPVRVAAAAAVQAGTQDVVARAVLLA
jgi:hypothetical protein